MPKNEYRDLIEESGSACVDIYNDFSHEEVMAMTPSIQLAWHCGEKVLSARLDADSES